MKRRWVIIRTDASPQIGAGHIMRCFSLAKALARFDLGIHFISVSLPDALETMLREAGFGFTRLVIAAEQSPNILKNNKAISANKNLPFSHSNWLPHSENQDALATQKIIQQHFTTDIIHAVVVDHYALASHWELSVGKYAPVFAIDDLSDRPHQSQWLLDQTLGKTTRDYASLITEKVQTLIGSEYALLRSEFLQARQTGLVQKKLLAEPKRPWHLLITLGAADKDNITAKVLTALNPIQQPLSIRVLAGSMNPHLHALNQLSKELPHTVEIIQNSTSVSTLILWADLCIGAAGSTSWERCCLGLPAINLQLAINQKTVSEQLQQSGAAINFGVLDDTRIPQLTQNISHLLNYPEKLQKMAQAGLSIVDGMGARRVATRIKNPAANVWLRKANPEDTHTLFKWQTQANTRRFSRNPEKPTWDEHNRWMQKQLGRWQDYFYIIETHAGPAGVVRLNQEEDDLSRYEISILIDQHQTGKKIAQQALTYLLEIHDDQLIWAHVHPENIASQRLFSQSRFQRLSSDHFEYRPDKS